MTLAEQLKTLSVPELERLQVVLQHLNSSATPNFDVLVAQLRSPVTSETDADLIGARTYELSLDGIEPAIASAQALAEFKVGKLKRLEIVVEPICPPHEGCPPPEVQTLPVASPAPATCNATTTERPPRQPGPPSNVVPFYCGKFFRRDPRDNEIW